MASNSCMHKCRWTILSQQTVLNVQKIATSIVSWLLIQTLWQCATYYVHFYMRTSVGWSISAPYCKSNRHVSVWPRLAAATRGEYPYCAQDWRKQIDLETYLGTASLLKLMDVRRLANWLVLLSRVMSILCGNLRWQKPQLWRYILSELE